MSTPSTQLKTILWAAVVALFLSGPAYAEIGDNEGTTKGKISVSSCGGGSFKGVVSSIVIDDLGPFWGQFVLAFDDEFLGAVDNEGIYIEAKPNKNLTMTLENEDWALLNEFIDELLEVNCGGDLQEPGVVIHTFNGKVSSDWKRLKIKFKSTFEWMKEGDEKPRQGRFNFNSRFDNLQPLNGV